MRTFRLVARILLSISGVLHIFACFQAPGSPGSIPLLTFGVIYFLIGLLLFNSKNYPVYLAIIVPITGMSLSLIKFGIPGLISLSALFKALETIAVVCCIILLFKSKKTR